MKTNPVLTQLYCEAVLREAQAEFRAGRLGVGELEGVKLDCRIGRLQGRQGLAALQMMVSGYPFSGHLEEHGVKD